MCEKDNVSFKERLNNIRDTKLKLKNSDNKSFSQRLLFAEGVGFVTLITYESLSGMPRYCFILTSEEKMKIFDKDKNGTFDLKNYGTILKIGNSHEPSKDDKDMLKKLYNIDVDKLFDI